MELSYPLLADPKLETLQAWGMVDASVPSDHPAYGFSVAGYFVVDEKGVITARYVNETYDDRTTSSGILVREFDGADGRGQGEAKTKHLTATWSTSNDTLRSGQRAVLILDVDLKKKMHVYSPDVPGRYIPIAWTMEEVEGIEFKEIDFPEPRELYLKPIKETLPVFEGEFRLVRDVRVDSRYAGSGPVELKGKLRYQACDDKLCYRPIDVPVRWKLTVEAHDRERVPEDRRRTAGN